MVYTITFNPALDYIIKLKSFKIGEINRESQEYILPGGKGINVSVILKELEIDNTALGFISGFVGEEIKRKVQEHGIKTDFIKIENELSRINVKITTPKNETAINSKGPLITQNYMELFCKKIEQIKNGDTIVLCGSIPRGMSINIYERICEKLSKKDIKIVVDATGDLLVKTLKYHPFLIKPNQDELGEIFNVKISNKDEAIQYGKKLQQKGAKNVLVSMGNRGAVLLDENGYFYKRNVIDAEKRVNTVGAGDSMVAGFIAGFELFHNHEKAFEMGMAAGMATACSKYLATKEEIYELLKKTENNG